MATSDGEIPHWLNQVVCVPTVGIRFQPRFRSLGHYTDRLDELVAKLTSRVKVPTTKIDVAVDGALALTISVSNRDDGGLTDVIRITHEALSIQTTYTLDVASASVHLFGPGQRLVQTDYTELLSSRLGDLESVIEFAGIQSIERFGVVATAEFVTSNLPPGLQLLHQHLGRPWAGGLLTCEAKLLAILKLGDDEVWQERCQHTISHTDAPNVDYRLQLDWQRRYTNTNQPLPRERAFRLAADEALQYFSKFGAGDLQYVGI